MILTCRQEICGRLWDTAALEVEHGIPEEVCQGPNERGHKVVVGGGWRGPGVRFVLPS